MPATSTHLWLRSEARATERRTPLVPDDVRRLLDAGLQVTVEESEQRVYPIKEYAEAGATIAGRGSWVDAPDDVFVLGGRRKSVHPVDTSVRVSQKPIQADGRMNEYLRHCRSLGMCCFHWIEGEGSAHSPIRVSTEIAPPPPREP